MAKRSKNLTLQDTVANQSSRRRSSKDSERGLMFSFSWGARICLLLAVISAPWMIGSVKCGAQLIISVFLLLAVGCWWIETALSTKKRQYAPYIALFVLLGMGIGFLQTMPLSRCKSCSIESGHRRNLAPAAFARYRSGLPAAWLPLFSLRKSAKGFLQCCFDQRCCFDRVWLASKSSI